MRRFLHEGCYFGFSTALVWKSRYRALLVGEGSQHPGMSQAFIGAEAVRGDLTRGQLRWNYTAVHPGVYIPNGAERTVLLHAVAAWLWTGRKGIIAGRAAAALHGAKWVNASTPIEVMPVTTVSRTALDLARHLPRDSAVAHLDALAAATGVTCADAFALAERYRGTPGI